MITQIKEVDFSATGLLPSLVSDYLSQKESLNHLYKYPVNLAAFEQAIKDKSKDETKRALLVDVLKEQYASLQTSPLVQQNIESILSPKTFTVVASHQPSLFLGPLFNVYKIAAAINLAIQLKQAYPDYNFVPIFWLGSEDHDIEELNHTYVNGKRVEWKDAGTGAVGRLGLNGISALIDELKAQQVNADVIALLETGLKNCKTFAQYNQYLVNELFKEHGLVVIDQDNAKLKAAFVEVIREEILSQVGKGVLRSNIDFLENNYKAQAKPRDVNFFFLGEGYRERIVYNSLTQKFLINNKDILLNLEQMIEEIETNPGRFSPNVIYRPLYQEMTLPNIAFVGGAGELSYWLELKPLFDYYQVNYPMLVLRTSGAIVGPSVIKKLEKLNLKLEDFFGDVEALITRYVKENMAPDVYLNGEKDEVGAIFDKIIAKAEAVDATLKQSAATEKQKAVSALENIEGKIVKAEKRKQETVVNQIRSIHATLFPGNEPQERKESFIAYFDKDFINEIVALANPLHKTFKFFSQA